MTAIAEGAIFDNYLLTRCQLQVIMGQHHWTQGMGGIMVQDQVVEALEAQIAIKQAELRRVQQDLAALQRTLAIFRGEQVPERSSPLHEPIVSLSQPKDSLPELAYVALKEVGKPMTGDQIVAFWTGRGKEVNKASLLGALYRHTKRKQTFWVNSGIFGLLEWQDKRPEQEQEGEEVSLAFSE